MVRQSRPHLVQSCVHYVNLVAGMAVSLEKRVPASDIRGGNLRRMPNHVKRPKILYLVTEDWYFCSHRLAIARAARDAGIEVAVATRVQDHGTQIRKEGFTLIPLAWRRRAGNPLRELSALLELIRIYRAQRPDLLHHVAVKPALLGSLAALVSRSPRVVNALAGLGYVFASPSARARMMRPLIRLGFRLLLNRRGSRVIVQNPDDRDLLERLRIVARRRLVLIRGSGVDLARFRPTPEPVGPPVVAFTSRMLWDKGVGVLVEAARLLKRNNVQIRVVLAGLPDPENPASVDEGQLKAWQEESVVEWRGFLADVPGLWAESHIAALPSYYGEGVPKSLLEAAACGRPIIAADGPGLREIVKHNENGLLVPPRDAKALADAIQTLAGAPDLRRRMGEKGRQMVAASFGEETVVRQTLDLYRALLKGKWPG